MDITGTRENDSFRGAVGSDSIFGLEGHDDLFGDMIHLNITGGDDNAVLIDGANDLIDGGSGDDAIYGEGAVHSLGDTWGVSSGQIRGGEDRIIGGRGNDSIYGDGFVMAERTGFARIFGGDDHLSGGDGDDRITGEGEVSLDVSSGFEPTGNWSVDGGNDRIVGGKGDDYLIGDIPINFLDFATNDGFNTGQDTFVLRIYERGRNRDTIEDFRRGEDAIEIANAPRSLDSFRELDTNRDRELNGDDRFVEEREGSMIIDLGRAAGGREDRNTIELAGYQGEFVDTGDFIFS